MLKQKGNALFLILIAVALFAALGFAVTRSRSGSGTIDKEKLSLDIGRAMQYNAYLAYKTQQMLLGGTSFDSLDFVDGGTTGTVPCSSGADCLFSTDGGVADYIEPPSSFNLPVGTVFIEAGANLSVTGTGAGSDIFMIYIGLSETACQLINTKLGLGSGINAISGPSTLDAYPGEMQACFISPTQPANLQYQWYYILAQR